jgi:hypothetical protein
VRTYTGNDVRGENRTELLFRQALTRLIQTPLTRTLLTLLTRRSKTARLKDQDIAEGV